MLMDRKQKRHRNHQGRVWCEESEGWEYQKWSGEYGRACKVEDSHRDKTKQCPWYIYSRECLSCTEFFVGLEASGEIETEELCGQYFFIFFSVWGEQHSSVCDEGYGQMKQAGQKGENCSSLGVTEWVRWPCSFTVAWVERYSVLSRRTRRLWTESERGTVVSSSWTVLTEIEDSFCLVPMSIASVFSLFSWSL